MERVTRRGRVFSPHVLEVDVDASQLLRVSMAAEEAREQAGVGDCEGAEVAAILADMDLGELSDLSDDALPSPLINNVPLPPLVNASLSDDALPSPLINNVPLPPLVNALVNASPDVLVHSDPYVVVSAHEPRLRSTPPPSPSQGASSHPKRKKKGGVEHDRGKEAYRLRRSKKRKTAAGEDQQPAAYRPPRFISQAHPTPPTILTDVKTAALPAAQSGAYVGVRSDGLKHSLWTLEELDGFRYIEWVEGATRVFVDPDKRILVTAASPPSHDYEGVIAGVEQVMTRVREERERQGIPFTKEQLFHRRGDFAVINTGISFGGGQVAPGRLVPEDNDVETIRILLNDPNVQRLAGFQNSVFAQHSPKLYQYYHKTLGALYSKYDLKRNFINSIFAAVAFNLGDQSVTKDHTDPGNLSHGKCAITPVGKYDHTKGGHLILFDLKMVIEFPAGAMIVLPSSVMRHGNTPIQPGETRMAVTQYAAGGLFRWVEHGFRAAKTLTKGLKPKAAQAMREKYDGPEGARWKWALGLFSKVDELEADRKEVFGFNY